MARNRKSERGIEREADAGGRLQILLRFTPSDWEKICESYVAGLSYEDRFKRLIKTCGHPDWTLKVRREADNEHDDQDRATISSNPPDVDLKLVTSQSR